VEADDRHLSVAVHLYNRGSTLPCLSRDPMDHAASLGVDIKDVAGSSEAVLLGGLGLVVLFVVF
jgi:hypothetical protein